VIAAHRLIAAHGLIAALRVMADQPALITAAAALDRCALKNFHISVVARGPRESL
jgi:uncharacterized protein (DUF1778 family)